MELVNQAFVLVVTYHFYAFTEFMTDPINRYYTGLSLVVVICLTVLVNLGILSVQILSIASRKMKLKYMAFAQAR